MFTGLIEEVGTVVACERRGDAAALRVRCGLTADASVGDSIAVDGVCLTITALHADGFSADLAAETLRVTTLGDLQAGDRVNLERPLRVGDRLGGHFVQGHVDGVGTVTATDEQGDTLFLTITPPADLRPLIAAKGSVAVDGVSLTVVDTPGDRFRVAIIPHTRRATTLGSVHPGARVNIEVDIIARYVARLLETTTGSEADR